MRLCELAVPVLDAGEVVRDDFHAVGRLAGVDDARFDFLSPGLDEGLAIGFANEDLGHFAEDHSGRRDKLVARWW